MMHAYEQIYLDKARVALARMLDFAVYDLKYSLSEFMALFLGSGIAEQFETGDPSVLVGKSGVEIAYEVIEKTTGKTEHKEPTYTMDRSEEYWTGWALAYYQWETALSFADILKAVPIEKICLLYSPYHEMDIRQFVDKMNELYKQANPSSRLKQKRLQAGLSQKELSEISSVPVRTIQQYEQRQKNINKANAETIVLLAKNLCCSPEDLLELI